MKVSALERPARFFVTSFSLMNITETVRLFMFISFFYLCEMPRRNDHALSKNKEKIVKAV